MESRRDFLSKGLAVSGLTAAGILPSIIIGCSRAEFDLILRGGTVIDGTGKGPFAADIGIRRERITSIGDLGGRHARRTLDVSGNVVCPGFIDVHSHTDYILLINPRAESKIRQGVTTEICGNCGDSPFPIGGVTETNLKKDASENYGIDIDWRDLDGYLNRLEKKGSAINFATLIGHGSLRGVIMGLENRPPSTEEMAQMKHVLRDNMDQGAFGLSTGLEYTPSSFAQTDELIELCKDVEAYDGVYATHIRNEDVRLEEAIAEALEISRSSHVELQISHLKACQKRNWEKLPRVLETIQRASDQGVPVHCDRYPYIAYSTSLKAMFPIWSREGSNDDFISRLENNSDWQKMLEYLLDKKDALGSWDAVLITRVSSAQNRNYLGKTINSVARELDRNPEDFVRDLLISENGQVGMCGFAMSEENTQKVLSFPLTMIGSDGYAWSPEGILGKSHPHPRYYGSFPRVLGYYVRDRKIMPLTEAIRKMTSLPTDKFRIKDRGRIQSNHYADIVVFNPNTILDKASFMDPHQYPEGIDYVIVNGRIVIERNRHTGMLPGKVLRRA
jgi:N-acyl-D-amino-acid deacylase